MRISDWSSDVCSSDLVTAGAGGAAPCLEMLGVAKVDQRVESADRLEHHIAALAAVAAVGAAIFDIFLAPERHGAGAAVAGPDEDLGLVEKMHRRPLRSEAHTSELQSLMRTSYDLFCLKNK